MKAAFVFPGQGVQVPGMGRELRAAHPAAARRYAEASDVLGFDLAAACENRDGELGRTEIVQPAVLVHGIACWDVLAETLPERPVAFAGHSLGEITALVCAGSIEAAAAVALVRRRAELMAAHSAGGGMSVVFGLPVDVVRALCREVSGPGFVVAVANRNSAEQLVLSGHRPALAEVAVRCTELGGVVREIPVAVPAHCELMEPAKADFAEAVRVAAPGRCAAPVISSLDGHAYDTGGAAERALVAQLTGCVDWPVTVSGLRAAGADVLIEVGPKPMLRDLVRLEHPESTVVSWGAPETLRAVDTLWAAVTRRGLDGDAGVAPGAAGRFLAGCLTIAIGTPAPKEISEARFAGAVQAPYRRIGEALERVRGGEAVPVTAEVVRTAARETLELLHAKGVASAVGREWLAGVADRTGLARQVADYLI